MELGEVSTKLRQFTATLPDGVETVILLIFLLGSTTMQTQGVGSKIFMVQRVEILMVISILLEVFLTTIVFTVVEYICHLVFLFLTNYPP
jgi:hypothetical protein